MRQWKRPEERDILHHRQRARPVSYTHLETAEQSQTQSSTDTTAPAQSAPITPQPSDTEARSENDAADVYKRQEYYRRQINY